MFRFKYIRFLISLSIVVAIGTGLQLILDSFRIGFLAGCAAILVILLLWLLFWRITRKEMDQQCRQTELSGERFFSLETVCPDSKPMRRFILLPTMAFFTIVLSATAVAVWLSLISTWFPGVLFGDEIGSALQLGRGLIFVLPVLMGFAIFRDLIVPVRQPIPLLIAENGLHCEHGYISWTRLRSCQVMTINSVYAVTLHWHDPLHKMRGGCVFYIPISDSSSAAIAYLQQRIPENPPHKDSSLPLISALTTSAPITCAEKDFERLRDQF